MSDLTERKYVIFTQNLAMNGSWNCPAIATFMAPSDEAAIAYCRKEFMKYYRPHSDSVFSAGGTFWGKVARCARADDYKSIWSYDQDKDALNPKTEPGKSIYLSI